MTQTKVTLGEAGEKKKKRKKDFKRLILLLAELDKNRCFCPEASTKPRKRSSRE